MITEDGKYRQEPLPTRMLVKGGPLAGSIWFEGQDRPDQMEWQKGRYDRIEVRGGAYFQWTPNSSRDIP
jgi:hypothetical protein